jgi:hypothetical protein
MVYEWSFGSDGSCPASTHSKKRHQGNAISRRKVTQTVKGFRGQPTQVTTYFDAVECAHCGVKHEQEWMPA